MAKQKLGRIKKTCAFVTGIFKLSPMLEIARAGIRRELEDKQIESYAQRLLESYDDNQIADLLCSGSLASLKAQDLFVNKLFEKHSGSWKDRGYGSLCSRILASGNVRSMLAQEKLAIMVKSSGSASDSFAALDGGFVLSVQAQNHLAYSILQKGYVDQASSLLRSRKMDSELAMIFLAKKIFDQGSCKDAHEILLAGRIGYDEPQDILAFKISVQGTPGQARTLLAMGSVSSEKARSALELMLSGTLPSEPRMM